MHIFFFTASAGAFLEQGVVLGIPISLGLAARYHFVKRNACEDELAALEDQDHKKD